jgi:hypothetical protein
LSWSPSEYHAFIRGAKHKEVDQLEVLSISAIFQRVANNKKGRVKPHHLYDAQKMHKQIDASKDGGQSHKKVNPLPFDPNRFRAAKKELDNHFNRKGR